MRTTIKDIAEYTGLSVSTVSLVLNKKEHRISPKTCKRIFDAARELNYRPNHLAKSLITHRTNTIGLIVPDITNRFFAEIAKGAEERCRELGYSLILCNTNDNPDSDADYANVLLDRCVDGILLTASFTPSKNEDEGAFSILSKTDKPVVLVDRIPKKTVNQRTFQGVITDNMLGGYLATEHLTMLGHKRIGCITGPTGEESSANRLFGYMKALQERKIIFDNELIKEGNYHTHSGYNLGLELIDKGVTAIFAFNDMMAFGVYRAAREKGLKIPEDLSVVGYDDLPFAELAESPLTSVRQPSYKMGVCAVDKIVGIIVNPEVPTETTLFHPQLIVRNSTSKPKSKGERYE